MEKLKRILLVEDDPHDVELTLAALEEFNLANEVTVVYDGKNALDYLKRNGQYKLRLAGNPAVVLLDIKLPKLSGLDVLKEVKKDEQLSNIPIVMLTSSREEPDLEKAYKLGANAYVVKPVDFSEFMNAIKQIGLFWAVLNESPLDSIGKVK